MGASRACARADLLLTQQPHASVGPWPSTTDHVSSPFKKAPFDAENEIALWCFGRCHAENIAALDGPVASIQTVDALEVKAVTAAGPALGHQVPGPRPGLRRLILQDVAQELGLPGQVEKVEGPLRQRAQQVRRAFLARRAVQNGDLRQVEPVVFLFSHLENIVLLSLERRSRK